MALIFADLIIPPIINIYRKYYGWRMAGSIMATFYAATVVAGCAIELLFGAAGLVPGAIAFLIIAAMLVVRFLRTGGAAMLTMMGGSPDPSTPVTTITPTHSRTPPPRRTPAAT